MASPQQTITGELRKWHHDAKRDGTKCVVGKMYDDIHEIWEDGEDAVIVYNNWVESANFYLAVTGTGGCVKCPKDEEIKYGKKSPLDGED